MFRRSFHIFSASAALVTTATGAFGQYYLPDSNATYLIGGLGFEQLVTEGLTWNGAGVPQGSASSLYSDTTDAGDYTITQPNPYVSRATIYWDGTNFSDAWLLEDSFQTPGSIGGANLFGVTTGSAVRTTRRNTSSNILYNKDLDSEGRILTVGNPDYAASVGLGFRVANGRRFSVVLNSAGYDFNTMTFAGRGAGASITWLYSLNGAAPVATGVTSTLTATFLEHTVDVSTLFFGNEATITIVAELHGPGTVNDPIVEIDSLQFIGAAPVSGTAPGISGTPPSPAVVGSSYSFSFAVAGSPVPTVTITAGELPPGLIISGRTISGTPTRGGSFTATATASNGVPPSAAKQFTIQVDELPAPPSVSNALSGPPPAGLRDELYAPYAFLVTGFAAPQLSLSGVLPQGLSLVGSTLSGTPVQAGTFDCTLTATNSLGTDSLDFRITINGAPRLTPPVDFVGRKGEAFSRSFVVEASPAPVFLIQGTLPPGIAFSNGTFSGTPTFGGIFPLSLVATNDLGEDRRDFSVVVNDRPTLALPDNGTISFVAGSPGSSSITATGVPAPELSVTGLPVWLGFTTRVDTQTGANTGVFAGTPPAGSAGSVPVTVRATNEEGQAEGGLNVVVSLAAEPPQIVAHPQDHQLSAGEILTLVVSASGAPAPAYQWLFNGAPIAGQTSPTLTIPNVQAANAGSYAVVVSNTAGTVTSNTAVVTVVVPVQITKQPVGTTVGLGGSFSLTVEAFGSVPLSYRWRRNGADIAGALAATYTVASASESDAGSYTVIVTNPAGSVTSAAAVVVFEGPPVIERQPVGATIVAGAPIVLTVLARSESALTYQWRKDGVPLTGGTSAAFEVAVATADDSGRYDVVVSNARRAVTSVEVRVAVVVAPEIFVQPLSVIVGQGGTATFTLSVAETEGLSYQWLKDGSDIAGATEAVFVLANVQVDVAAAIFQCRVANAAGTIVSRPARVVVFSPATRTVDMTGGIFEVQVFSSAELPAWDASTDAEWLTTEIFQVDFVPRLRYTVAATAAGQSRSADVTIVLGDLAPATHRVEQKQISLFADSFADPIDPTGTTGSWVPFGAALPEIQTDVAGRVRVLALSPFATAAAVSQPTGPIPLADASPVGGVYTRVALGASGSLSAETEVYINGDANVSGAVEASLAVLRGGTVLPGPGGSALSAAADARLALWRAGDDADERLRRHVWPTAHFRGEDGNHYELDLRTAIPHDELSGRWVKLRIEITAERAVSFWMDVEPFGNALRVWAPTVRVHQEVLSGGRLLLGLRDSGLTGRSYHAASAVAAGFLPTPGASRLVNLSTRATVGWGDKIMIAGFGLSGPRIPLLFRGIGPGLAALGVPGVLSDPRLVVYDGAVPPFVIRVQGSWQQQRSATRIAAMMDTEQKVGAFPLGDGSDDSAWLFNPGSSDDPGLFPRTIHLKSASETDTGVALLELYDPTTPAASEFVNLSTRAYLEAGSVMIPGFIVSGNASRLILVRAVGPELAKYGVSGAMGTTRLVIYRQSAQLLENSRWSSGPSEGLTKEATELVHAFALPNGSGDSAQLVRLPPDLYTVIVSGASASEAGVVLAEIYSLPLDADIDTARVEISP